MTNRHQNPSISSPFSSCDVSHASSLPGARHTPRPALQGLCRLRRQRTCALGSRRRRRQLDWPLCLALKRGLIFRLWRTKADCGASAKQNGDGDGLDCRAMRSARDQAQSKEQAAGLGCHEIRSGAGQRVQKTVAVDRTDRVLAGCLEGQEIHRSLALARAEPCRYCSLAMSLCSTLFDHRGVLAKPIHIIPVSPDAAAAAGEAAGNMADLAAADDAAHRHMKGGMAAVMAVVQSLLAEGCKVGCCSGYLPC